jgi:hypothetical protein
MIKKSQHKINDDFSPARSENIIDDDDFDYLDISPQIGKNKNKILNVQLSIKNLTAKNLVNKNNNCNNIIYDNK